MKMKTVFLLTLVFVSLSIFSFAALDLRFTNAITMTPDPATAGTIVTFSVNWKNFGAAVDNMNIIGGIDGLQIFSQLYDHIDSAVPQKKETFSWAATAGDHTVWFELDPSHICGDSNYSNNRVEQTITIGTSTQTNKPNLTVGAVYNPTQVLNGADITFTATVTNNGNASSNPCKLGLSEFGAKLKEYDIPALMPGQMSTINAVWKANCGVNCNVYVQLTADCTNLNDESNESDNYWLKTYICDCSANIKSNLKISGAYSPTTPKKGDKVTFNIIIKNDGQTSNSATTLAVYKSGILIETIDVDPIDPNGQVTINFDWTAECNQNCTADFDFFTDYLNYVDESNESDNHWLPVVKCFCGIVSIKPNNLITKPLNPPHIIAISNLTKNSSKITCYPGQKKIDYNYSIKNSGKAPAAASKLMLKVYDGNNLLSMMERDVTALNGGQIFSDTISIVYCVHNAKIVVEIDSNKEVPESNEKDNVWEEIVNCPTL